MRSRVNAVAVIDRSLNRVRGTISRRVLISPTNVATFERDYGVYLVF